MTRRHWIAIALAAPLLAAAEEKVDLSVIHRIRVEAFDNSKVMEHAFYLTEVHGPRLTNSEGYRKAADWAKKQLADYKLNARLESWGPFGRSWDYTRFSAHLLEPRYAPLIGFPLAWSTGTNGTLTGEPFYAPIRGEADVAKYKGQLKGKIVLIDPLRELSMATAAPGKRYSDADLAQSAVAPDPATRSGRTDRMFRDGNGTPMTRQQYMKWRESIRDLLIAEGAALAVQTSTRGDGGGTVFGQMASGHETKDPVAIPMVALAPEHYNRLVRLAEHKIPVKVEFEVQAKVSETAEPSVNVIADLPGGSKKDEVVILGAHLDSWHGGTGATDNASGVAVVMEAARILKSLNLPLARTVRVALWSAEEQGFLGARAYVEKYLADPKVMKPLAEHGKVTGYFNYDNGTGKIRGIYLQDNDMARPIFEAWLAPFKDLGVTTVTIRNTGGTDHIPFDRAGIPAFQFIQDEIEYSARTHHSNMDVYDRLQKGDLMQSAAVMAAIAYHAANRPDMLPRKPMPKPEVKEGERKPGNPPAS